MNILGEASQVDELKQQLAATEETTVLMAEQLAAAHNRNAAKDEQLAEMREALELHDELRDLTYDTGYYAACVEVADDDSYMPLLKEAIGKRNYISERMKQALSAAPRRGRVLWEEEVETSFDGMVRFWKCDYYSGDRDYVGEIMGHEDLTDWALDGKPKIVTVREVE